MNRKRVVSGVILIVAGLFFMYAFVVVSVPNDEFATLAAFKIPARDSLGYQTYAMNGGQNKPIFFDAGFNFSASGSLSVNNPITVHVEIYNTNDSSFSTDYIAASFTWCYPLKDDWANSGNLNSCVIPLHPAGQSTHGTLYEGTGTFKWLQSGPSYLWLIPNNASWILNNQDLLPQYEQIALTVNPVSDTLSTQFNLDTLRLTYILVGLGVLALQPVLETFLWPEVDRRRSVLSSQQKPLQPSKELPSPPTLSPSQARRKERRRLAFLRRRSEKGPPESDQEKARTEE